ncbi:DUF3857 domain-containing transglutaminase family protein [Microbulbifer pacificus]|uniref:DUF3857 domain-containing transglutaminase family protein n=1 Tax=Microbulbifer pacificus TaxID=407164 RepID=UPI000CF53D5E|nr:DUF3857 domain-containing transglutaminase family protein [Microbulbifer pacificus]
MKQILLARSVARTLWSMVALLVMSPALAAPAEYTTAPRPDWVQPVEVPKGKAGAGPVDDGLRNLLLDSQINLSGDRKERFFRFVMQPLRQQGLQQISSISLGFSPAYEELVIHDVSVVRDGVRSDRLATADIKLFQREEELDRDLYAERWTAMLLLKDLRIGDIVEYSYTVRGSNPVLGDKYFGRELLAWGVAIEQMYIGLLSPKAQPLYVRTSDGATRVRQRHEGSLTRYWVDIRNSAALRQEDGVPEWLSPYPYLEYTQYADWRQVNGWANTLYGATADPVPAEFARWLQELRGTPAYKAAMATQWIQEHIRYFGIEHGVNSHLPSSPLETYERRFGDCKDKTVLLIAALRYLGIEAHPALVSSVENLDLDVRLPSPGQFDHVITTFLLDGKRYWVDPTATSQNGELEAMSLPDFNWALVVNGEGEQLTRIEAVTPEQLSARISVEETLILDDNRQSAVLEVVSHYVGWSAEDMRAYAGYRDVDTITNDFLQFYARYFPAIEKLDPVEISEVDGRNELRVREKYRLRNVGESGGAQNLLKLAAASVVANISLPKARQRTYPFRLPGKLEVDERFTVIAKNSGDLRWLNGQNAETIANPWFEFSREVEKAPQQVTVNYRYQSLDKSVAPEQFAEYLQAIDRLDPSLTYSVWLAPVSVTPSERRDRARNLARDLLERK